ncbi:discoidin domain-containing protein [Clostridium tertium]|uniref:discoidin domain-containing protein n=1 Tax=Clostridium tertium TaxID=1559 RepID=UPI000BE3AC1C|nr:discoidin domain-containing protein [Clostridium tertium]
MRNKRYNISKRILPLFIAFTMMFSFVPVRAEENTTEVKRENLALGKSATASGYEGGSTFTADKVIDGKVDRPADINKAGSSRWASNLNAVNPWITIDLNEVKAFDEVVIEWERRNVNSYKVEVSNDNITWANIHKSTTKNEFREVLDVGLQKARYVKITIENYSPTQEGSNISWNTVAMYEVEIYNNKPEEPEVPEVPEVIVPAAGENVALSKNATSSSNETNTLTPDKAVDGLKSKASRWASAVSSNPQWITVDLGAKTQIENLVIEWERKNATEYKVQVSDNNENWTDIYAAKSAPTKNRQEINLDEPIATRYVRVYVDKHIADADGVNWNNVSIYEIEIYNGGIPKGFDEITNSINVRELTIDDEVLPMPEVQDGYEISFIGADYEEVIGSDMKINRPLVDTKVRVNFEVKQGDKKAYTPDIEVLVPGAHEATGNDAPTVIPELREWLGGSGNFEINNGSRIVIAPSSEAELIESMNVFAEDYKDVVGREIEVVVSDSPKNGDFYFELNNKRPELRTEGYYMEIGDFVKVESNEAEAAFLSTRTILQILKQNGTTIPQGITRDYPLSDVRGFMLDVGRKPITLDFLYDTVKLMSWYKMNDFQVHLNDNYIFLEDYSKTGEDPMDAYAGFRLESDIKEGGNNGLNKADLTSKDTFYTKDEFRTFIKDSREIGVNIVPEFDTPAHSLSFTKVRPDLKMGNVGRQADHLDVTNPGSLEFVKGLWDEYLDGENPVFDSETIVNVGTDEYDAKYTEEFRKFTDDLLGYMQDEKDRTVRLWGSLSARPGNTPVRSENVQMNIWNNGWSDPSDMFKAGYDLINTEDGKLYIVPDAGYYYDYLNSSYIYNNYEVSKFGNGDVIPAGSPQMIGGTFAVWNDMVDKKANGIVELDIYDRILPAVQAISEKMWGLAEDKTYAEFQEVAAKVSNAPNSNPRYKVESKTEKVLDYNFKGVSKGIVPDNSGNGYNSVALNNSTIKNGVLKLNGSNSYLENSIENIGPNYTVSLSVKRDENSNSEEQVLFESEKGSFKAVQKETGKVGFSREFYDYSFDYELPKGEWVDISIVGRMTKTELYVNGEYVDEVSKTSEARHNGTFVLPLEKVGSETKAFNGEIKSLKVYNVANNVADETVIPQETMKASATSEHPNVGSEGLASFAIDGKPGTIWHTNYDTPVQLPQSITLDLGKAYTINKFSYLPRSNGGNGTITKYELQVSTNGTDFTTVSDGSWAKDATLKVVNFDEVPNVTHVRLVAKEGAGGFATAAELNVYKVKEVTPEPKPEVDKTALKTTIDYADEVVAEGLLNGVVPVVVKEFNAALEEAKAIYENEDSTEEEVDEVFKRLVNVIWMLEYKQGNKEALKALLDSAKGLVEKVYTADSWAVLQVAIEAADAVLADENAMQEEIDEILDSLKSAIDGLVKIEVKKEALENLVNKLEKLDKKVYTESTWTPFENALKTAKEVLANTDAIQEEVDSAYNTLLKSSLDLRLIPDKSKLEDLINKAKAVDLSKYTEKSANELKIQLARASEVFANEEATQEEINKATRSLDTALNDLIAKGDGNGGSENNGNGNGSGTETPSDSNKAPDNGGKLPATGVESGPWTMVAFISIIIGSTLIYRKRYNRI